MSVIRIYKEPSYRVDDVAKRNDRRRRFSPFASGVKGEGIRVGDSIGIKSISNAESETRRVTTPAEVRETSSGGSDRWAVVLFDDSHHSMDYVIWALLKTVPELSSTEASLIMLEAHNTGKGVVTLCGLAQAEKIRDSLRVLQLGCDIEPGW
jgi:ATP-dependent Clp protease adaptor protein ClpS